MLIEKFEFIQREFKSVKLADLPKNHPFRKYSSPTPLLNEQVVFGSPIEGEEGFGGYFLDEGAVGEVEGVDPVSIACLCRQKFGCFRKKKRDRSVVFYLLNALHS